MFAFPGGRVEPDETLEAAAVRECREETGIIGSNPRLYAIYELPDPDHPYVLSVFLLDCDTDADPIASDDAASAGWFTAKEIEDLPCPLSVRECIEQLEEAC